MRLLILTAVICLFSSAQINAADSKLYARDGYERIVIDGANVSVVSEKEKSIELKISSDAGFQALAGQTNAIVKISKNEGHVSVIFADTVTKIRYFKIGSRFILDMFVDASVVATPKTKEKTAAVSHPVFAPVVLKEKSVESHVSDDDVEIVAILNEDFSAFLDDVLDGESDAEVVTADDETHGKMKEVSLDAPHMDVLETVSPLAHPTIITLSSTTRFSLAVFQRYDRLFIVTDKKSGLPPEMTGAGKDLNWDIKDVEMKRGNAWSVAIPSGAFVRAEGGNLVWRIIVSDQDPELKSSKIRRSLDDEGKPIVDILLGTSSKILRLSDADYGDDLAVFVVPKAKSRMLTAHDFIDFDILPAVVGAVVKPQSDGVRVSTQDDYVSIEKKNGLILSSKSQNDLVELYLNPQLVDAKRDIALSNNRVFFFGDWGADIPLDQLLERRQQLDVDLVKAVKDEKIGFFFDLARLSLSRAMGQEALGYLNIAGDMNKEIMKSPEYKALKGAAHFLARQYDLASEMFSDEILNRNTEVRLWNTATLSALNDKTKALEIYPDNAEITRDYPLVIRMQIVPPVIQAMIETNKGEKALSLIKLIDVEDKSSLTSEDYATISYLKGTAQKIAGYPDKAITSLSVASLTDKLGPYGIRSEMNLVNDGVLRETLLLPEAIKRMERLRFAWRGDELEEEIYQSLGRLYIANKQPRQGLNILKRAAEDAKTVKKRRSTVRSMSQAYNNLFIGDMFDELDPVEAITVYDEFKELTPVGNEGNQIIDRLADKLMDIGLLSRSVSVLHDKMERLEGGEDAIKTGLRIAAIQLLDRQPKATAETLKKVNMMMALYDGGGQDDFHEKIIMLKARAFSDMGQAENALFMMEGLPDTDDTLRLRVDTAWKSGNWIAVSDNLDKLIFRENLSTEIPPTQTQTQMVLNQAIALSLSDQYDALQRFAGVYGDIMKQSPSYKTFKIITRPSKSSSLADRETLLGLTSEVDLFSAFLEGSKDKK
ncbi:MAG: hypothetical protein COB76_00875 [Alphaproteobacteria bacterium]|nr:MAG: hypothetical protein COB76_00875 [Alphaproteobacteria bacterium]